MPNLVDSKKNKHLTHEDRRQIEECLSKRMTFKDIAKLIGKDPTTISYEIKHHRQAHTNSFTTLDQPCPLLLKAPFVCNGCQKRHSSSCHHVRFIYRSDPAQNEYKTVLRESREGIPLNKQEFYETDRIISSALAKGQHIYHIMASSDSIHCSKSTVYRHFNKGYYSASRIDLPRAVKFKPRKAHKDEYVPKGIRIGRTYDDFIFYMEQEKLQRHTELDTVIGRVGGKVIMTIHFSACNFMTGLLLDDKTSVQAASKITALKDMLREHGFQIKDTFDVFLADNGGEFADVFSFEEDPEENREIRMFFCDPMTPSQKPQIEKNHTLLRDIIPKGSSFDDFSQETVDLIFSHVNSVKRAMYGGKSAYDMFCFIYSQELPELFGITRIDADQVIQSPKLLKGIADLKKNL